MLFIESKKKRRTREERLARNEANLHCSLLKLPAEIRNAIYAQILPSNRTIVKRQSYIRSHGWLGRLPAILQTCHQLREELLPYFYGSNTVIVILEDLMMHRNSRNRRQSCINLLPTQGLTCWRKVKIESCARCFHKDGFARNPSVDAFVDRTAGTVVCRPRYGDSLEKCCLAAAEKYKARLDTQIKALQLHDGSRVLRRADFDRLMRRMDNARSDWPKSPRRVIPRYF